MVVRIVLNVKMSSKGQGQDQGHDLTQYGCKRHAHRRLSVKFCFIVGEVL